MSDSESSDDDLAGVFDSCFDTVETEEIADSDIVKQNQASRRKVHDAYAAGPTPAERDAKKMELLKLKNRRKRPMNELMEDESDNIFSSPAKRTKNNEEPKNIFEEENEEEETNIFEEKPSSLSASLKPLKKKNLPKNPTKAPESSKTNFDFSPKKKSKKSAPAMDMGVMQSTKKTASSLAGTSSETKLQKLSISEGESAVCGLSGIVLRNREVSHLEVEAHIGLAKFTHCHFLATGADEKVDFATIGIVVQKVQPQTLDKKGNPFTIFSLSNLRDIPRTIKIMAFGENHKKYWKTQVGAVCLVVNPKKMPARGDSKYEQVPTFMLQGPDCFKIMGFSADLGTCTSKTAQGQPCRQFVNLSVSQLCPNHVMKQWNRASSARGELSAKTGTHGLSGAGSAWQKTKGDFFFSGGKTFQALPPSQNPACNKNSMLDSLAKSHANKGVRDGLKEMKKNPGIVVMNAPAGKMPAENTNVMVKSSMHGGRMLAAALGRSHENESLMASKRMKAPDPKVSSISAAQLLKQKNEEFAARKREALKRQKEEAIKKASQGGNAPTLGGGLSKGLNLTGGPKMGNSLFSKLGVSNDKKSVEERRKLRAAAVLKSKNAKSPEENKQSKILQRVSQSIGEKKEKVERTFMGQKTSCVDIKAILEKKSKYHASVEDLMSAEQDFYFSVLEKKEERQTKMDGVMKADAQVVTCKDCKYTYWSPHENCKKQNHNLVWKEATKRWFQCKNCPTQRAITFSKYPKTSCSSCGQGTRWVRVAAGDTNRVAAKERDSLLIRGEERKWVNS